jgi:ATP-binding cassette, subfamily B, multidrug efflux pump
MVRLLRYLRKQDWFFVILIVGLTVLQVYCTMTLMDYISNITKSIQYLYYHNNPGLLLGNMYDAATFSWTAIDAQADTLAAMIAATSNQDASTVATMIHQIAIAGTGDIWFNGGMMLLMALSMVACQALIAVLAAGISSHLATSIRKDINDKVTSFSLAELNRFSTASLITRTTNDIQMYQMCLLLIMRMFFAAPITAIWAVLKIQSISWTLMIPALCGIIALVVFLLVMLFLVMPKFKISQKLLDKVNGQTRENVTGIRVVHSYNAEKYQKDKFAKTNDELTKVQMFTGKAMAFMSPYISLIMNIISLLVYWVGAYLINDGTTDYAQVLSMMMLSTQVIMAFMMLLMMFYMIPRANVSAKRINEVLETKNSVLDPEKEEELKETGSIEFRDVSFRYPDGDNDVISHISFKASKGETIAFIGETGSGKSTIVNLVPRLYDATEGEILIDGVNVKNLKQHTLRGMIGFVPQKGLLFTGNVTSNVAFGNPNATKEQVIQACKVAEADSFINEMPNGYFSPIAQGGTNVSGGQRQRLCIARAVLLNPQFLVFDDSFSALDFKTDRKVRDNLKEFAKDATKLIVAQRIGTIMDADHIVVLSEGKMVGYGTHKELLENCPTYRDIALSQLSKEELGL